MYIEGFGFNIFRQKAVIIVFVNIIITVEPWLTGVMTGRTVPDNWKLGLTAKDISTYAGYPTGVIVTPASNYV